MSNKICRCCASENGTLFLFEEVNSSILKLLECVHLIVEKYDGLPEYLCDKCIEILEIIRNFKAKCEETDLFFRKLLSYSYKENYEETEVGLTIETLDYPANNYEVSSAQGSSEDLSPEIEEELEEEFIVDSLSDNDNLILQDDEIQGVNNSMIPSEIVIDSNLIRKTESKEIKQIGLPNVENSLKCDICDEEFENSEKLMNHKVKAGKCNKWLLKRNNFNVYLDSKGYVEYYSCALCSNKYIYRQSLSRHFRFHHKKELPFVCALCGERFQTSEEFEPHKLLHSKKCYSCDICGRKVTTLRNLKMHKKSHVPKINMKKPVNREYASSDSEDTYLCPHCGKISKKLTSHFNHLRTHSDGMSLQCPICLRKFKHQNVLNSHLRIHTGEKPFECDVCSMTFRQSQHLKGHKLTHSGLKPHQCKYCNKTFALKGNLRVHERLHTGETPYQCSECGREFQNLNKLKRHKNNHLVGISKIEK